MLVCWREVVRINFFDPLLITVAISVAIFFSIAGATLKSLGFVASLAVIAYGLYARPGAAACMNIP